jgi:hypothetical protein
VVVILFYCFQYTVHQRIEDQIEFRIEQAVQKMNVEVAAAKAERDSGAKENRALRAKLKDTEYGLDQALSDVREAHSQTARRAEEAHDVVLDLLKKGKEGEDEVEQLRKLHKRVKFEQSSGGQKKKWKRIRMVHAQKMSKMAKAKSRSGQMGLLFVKEVCTEAGYEEEYVKVCSCASVDVSGEIRGTVKEQRRRLVKLQHVVANWYLGLECQSESLSWVQGAASKLGSSETGSRATGMLQGVGAFRTTTSTWRHAKKSMDTYHEDVSAYLREEIGDGSGKCLIRWDDGGCVLVIVCAFLFVYLFG